MKTNLLGRFSLHLYTRLTMLMLVASFLPNAIYSQDDDGWELKRDKGDIVVYIRETEGSDIKDLKFETELEASLNSIAAILMNVEGFDDWVYSSEISKTVEQISDTEVIYYNIIDFPWPLSNRDLVLRSRFWQDDATKAIHSQTYSVHDFLPEEDGLVRMTKADIHWIFTPIGNGKVKLVYTLSTDPGGSIPAWMINLAADQGPLMTMVKFKEEIEKEKYRNAKLAFVQELE